VVEAGTGASVKTQGKHHSTPSPKKAGKMDNHRHRRQQSPKIKQFGSLVTGLALESSDMDMAVTNLDLPDREKMIESLGVFADCLRKWEMIQDLNAISTASIPVIKAIVDLNQLREKEMNHLEDQ
jgi:DNA polymerase sigma